MSDNTSPRSTRPATRSRQVGRPDSNHSASDAGGDPRQPEFGDGDEHDRQLAEDIDQAQTGRLADLAARQGDR